MNGASLWQSAQAPDGRTYYYNAQTKETQWTKPDVLLTPAEVSRALFKLYYCSLIEHDRELARIPHGQSTLLRVAESIGTTNKPTRQHGRCHRSLKMLSNRIGLLSDPASRMFHPSLTEVF